MTATPPLQRHREYHGLPDIAAITDAPCQDALASDGAAVAGPCVAPAPLIGVPPFDVGEAPCARLGRTRSSSMSVMPGTCRPCCGGAVPWGTVTI